MENGKIIVGSFRVRAFSYILSFRELLRVGARVCVRMSVCRERVTIAIINDKMMQSRSADDGVLVFASLKSIRAFRAREYRMPEKNERKWNA